MYSRWGGRCLSLPGPNWTLVGLALVGPLGPCGPPLGPCGPGPWGRPWVLVGTPGPLWIPLGPCGPPWALVGWALGGPPWVLVGPPGPLWACRPAPNRPS